MFRPYESFWDFFTDTPVIYSLILTVLAGIVVPYIVAYFVRIYRVRKLAAQRADSVGRFNSQVIEAINYHRTNISHCSGSESSEKGTPTEETLLIEESTEISETQIRNRKKEMEEVHKKFVNFKDIEEDKDLSKLSVKPSINSSSTSLNSDKENDGYHSHEEEILVNGVLDANCPAEDTGDVLSKLSNMELHGKLATAQLKVRTKKLQESMSDEEREQERKIREEQLNAIFTLMKEQEEKFGLHTKGELEDQLKMYNL
uniref:Matrix-remodeling-associated protein 7 n=1 Tax=Acrobeloides nanus TaxID=290746 RepID=A0A914CUC5_9BILA